MPDEKPEITLGEQVKAWKTFEDWLHNKFSQESVDKVQDELSTVGSEKKREGVIQIKLFPLEDYHLILDLEGREFEREDKTYHLHVVSLDDKSSKQT